MEKIKRINPDQCFGIFIDIQAYFVEDLPRERRLAIEKYNTALASLLTYFKIPVLVTLERPLIEKGLLIPCLDQVLSKASTTYEKDFFDLTRESEIKNYIHSLNKKQVIIAGCETDVCVLQSCLSLLELGFEVFLVAETLFSSAEDTHHAIEQLKANGAVFLSFKTLHYEFQKSVIGSPYYKQIEEELGTMTNKVF